MEQLETGRVLKPVPAKTFPVSKKEGGERKLEMLTPAGGSLGPKTPPTKIGVGSGEIRAGSWLGGPPFT